MSPAGGDEAGRALARLAALAARLRAPDGCPWDREQTPASAAGYLLEEAYEALEAIESGDPAQVRGELGDLLFQVVFQAQLFAEAGHFELSQVIAEVEAKMIRRHPHVFGQAQAADAAAVKLRWDQIKRQERAGQPQGLLDSVPQAAPALVRAQRLGQRAAQVGFDWPGAAGVWEKTVEETRELAQAAEPEAASRELGDLLFTWAQWARHRGLKAEAALREANRRFARRFAAMEALAASQGRSLAQLNPQEQDELWRAAKAAETGLEA
ncbi:MAG: nucleoside triphosphate pyrophosphohydrolase [Thermodesulfobacteriota bacterium]